MHVLERDRRGKVLEYGTLLWDPRRFVGWVPCVPLHQPFQLGNLERIPVDEASGTTRRDVRELRREVRRAI